MMIPATTPRAWWIKLLVAFAFGAMTPLSLAPYSIWLFAIISPSVLALLLRHSSSLKPVFAISFTFGLGMFLSGVSWVYVSIHEFGGTGLVLALIMTALFVGFLAAVFTLPFCLFFKVFTAPPLTLSFLFPAIWLLGEWLRSWLLTGFPWLYIGYAHLDTYLSAWAPIGGVFSLSFASVLSGTLLLRAAEKITLIAKGLESIKSVSPQLFLCSVILILIWATPYALKDHHWTETKDDIQSVALIQPNVELYRKWNPMYFPEIFSGLYDLSSQHWDKDIQVWPEAAIPSVLNNVRIFTDDIDEKARETNTHIFTGVLYDNYHPDEVYNSVIGLGLANGTYFKQKLVPFGEYVPFEDQLRGLINFFNLPNSVIRAGPFRKNALSATTKNGYSYSVAPFICYEVVYPDFVAKHTKESSLLLTISNDAWFGSSNGPLQHFEMVRMRALENQKYMLRATNTGVSGIIDEKGHVLNISEQFIETSLEGFVELREGSTPYSRFGSTPIVLLSFTIIGVFYLNRRRIQPTQ